MTYVRPRMRMFAGPNGSGKSKLKSVLPPELLGIYLNPDEIEEEIRSKGYLDLAQFQVLLSENMLRDFFRQSTLLRNKNLMQLADSFTIEGDRFRIESVDSLPYLVSALCDLIRRRWIAAKISFTFETVMSSPDKVELLKNAKRAGYRTYLYFIATEDPAINISRVENRVKLGGHGVPADKIRSRYFASLGLLRQAIKASDRAYIFDNTTEGEAHTWIAEIEDGRSLTYKSDIKPAWVSTYLD